MNMEDWAKNEIEIACKHERGEEITSLDNLAKLVAERRAAHADHT